MHEARRDRSQGTHLLALHELGFGFLELGQSLFKFAGTVLDRLLQVRRAQQVGDPGLDFQDRERLGEEVVGPALERPDLGILVHARGQKDDLGLRHQRIATQYSADFDAIHARQHQIEKDEVRLMGQSQVNGALTVI